MRLGLDFDNTIVCYDSLFHKIAIEKGVITPEVLKNKLAVRDYLRATGNEEVWTEMQGEVYGVRMSEASLYPGARECLKWAKQRNITISIISHKTKNPYLGPQYDLHEAARKWIESNLQDEDGMLIKSQNVFFEIEKKIKINRIDSLKCDVYIDDLPEILTSEIFPIRTAKILFDPDEYHVNSDLFRVKNWSEVKSNLEERWKILRQMKK
jgi:hypothetical protein